MCRIFDTLRLVSRFYEKRAAAISVPRSPDFNNQLADNAARFTSRMGCCNIFKGEHLLDNRLVLPLYHQLTDCLEIVRVWRYRHDDGLHGSKPVEQRREQHE